MVREAVRIGKKQPIPYKEVEQLIFDIPELRIRAMVAIQYGTGSRIGELITYTHHLADKSFFETHGLLKKNIIEHDTYYEFIMPAFKNPKTNVKNSLIVKREKFLIEPIMQWLESCPEQVFGLRQSRARQLIKEYTGYSSHYFRHSRAQHLVDIFNFNAYELKDALAHAALDTSVAYVLASPRTKVQKIITRLEQGGI